MKSNKLYVGFDPAFRKYGFSMCIIDYSDKSVYFKTFKDFLAFCSWVLYDAPDNMIATIENSNLQKKTFDMSGSRAVVARKSRNVGKNMAVSQCATDLLKSNPNFKVFDISPKEKGRKWSEATAKGVLLSEGLKSNKAKLTQDQIDSLQIALIGKRKR